jgi:DNA-binding winged helix-turn-helix (wHTH) protein
MRISFADLTLDGKTRQLWRGQEELHLEPKAFELLELLLEQRPAAVSKREIQERLWPDTFVSDASLTGLVAQIRQALGDDPKRPRFVRTVYGFGYAFSGEATAAASAGADRKGPAHWIVWEGRSMPLLPGENVVGRAGGTGVQIDAPGISRRHAHILLADGTATLEDLGSKNGTYLNGRRLNAPALLHDGDVFRLGRHTLVYRASRPDGSTETEVGIPHD